VAARRRVAMPCSSGAAGSSPMSTATRRCS
jgi:hypothetical protein